MNRFLAAFCGFGLGVLAGLLIAAATQPTLRHVEGERAATIERVAELESQVARREQRLTESLGLIGEMQESVQRSADEHKELQDAIGQLADNEFRSQAFFGLLLRQPESRRMFLDAAMDDFHGDWWAPDETWKAFWGSDFLGPRSLPQIVEHGSTARATFRAITLAAPTASYRNRLEMAKVGVKILPELEKERARKAEKNRDRAT